MVGAEVIRVPLSCPLAPSGRGAFGVVGNMDGVHRGHQALVGEAVSMARDLGHPPAAIVFEPHPRRVFQPEAPPFLLTSLSSKARLLGALGVETVFVLPFIEDLYGQSPEAFVRDTLRDILGLSGIATGTDFRFGKGREGNAATLATLAAANGMTARTIIPISADGSEKVSSSSVRAALREGRPEDASALLGRPWSIEGEVVLGRKLARTLDFPTANIPLGDILRPLFGVYAVTVTLLADGSQHAGIANIGTRPTVDGKTALLEAHLFDFDGDLYGQRIEVALRRFLRPERKFDGLDALKAQIASDVEHARNALPAS